MTSPPRILTVGTGAVGAIYSWRLSKSCEITTVCRSSYESVLKDGFDIDSKKFGKEVFHPHKVSRTVSECQDDKFDYIMVTLKALPEVYNIAEIIAPVVKDENTTIVLIQNGLGVEEPIVERFPNNPLVSIVAYIGVSQFVPGKITMTGNESLIVGNYIKSERNSEKEMACFVELLKKGGVTVETVEDIERIRWQKLFWNAAFSPVCTLTGMNTSELLANKDALGATKELMYEIIGAANNEGYIFDKEQQVQAMIGKTIETAENYKPSMQLDHENNRPMEIEVILGCPLKRAKAKGLSVPKLEAVYSICSAANTRILNLSKA